MSSIKNKLWMIVGGLILSGLMWCGISEAGPLTLCGGSQLYCVTADGIIHAQGFDSQGTVLSPVYGTAYGMKCDGVTSDRVAFQNTLDAAKALALVSTGTVQVILPIGRCVDIVATYVMPSNFTGVNLHGEGTGFASTLLVGPGGSSTVLSIDDGYYWSITNLGFDGNSTTAPVLNFINTSASNGVVFVNNITILNGSTGTGSLLKIAGWSWSSFSNIQLGDGNLGGAAVGSIGIEFGNDTNTYYNTFNNIVLFNVDIGVKYPVAAFEPTFANNFYSIYHSNGGSGTACLQIDKAAGGIIADGWLCTGIKEFLDSTGTGVGTGGGPITVRNLHMGSKNADNTALRYNKDGPIILENPVFTDGAALVSYNSGGNTGRLTVMGGKFANATPFSMGSADTLTVKGAMTGTTKLPDQEQWATTLFASLGTPLNGTVKYCSDCTIANPCAGAGTGAFAKRLNGVWVCN